MTMHRYQPRRPLQAIDPQAFFGLFASFDEPENEERDDVTVVNIRGPLSQYDDWWSDSYEAIRKRVDEACAKAASVVVLRIDSPGGDVAGMFDTARSIRAACDLAGKRLLVHVEGQCTSAAYALATAADRIVASRTAAVGSIGVIAARLDETKAMEDHGYKITLITSGARKADGASCKPMEPDELATFQAEIDGLAAEFFDVVSLRRGIPSEKIAAFEAASFRGSAAVKAGLVDELGSFDYLIASLGADTAGDTMNEKEKEARDALLSIAEDEERDDEERERARRALAALDGEENDDGDEPADGDEEEAQDEEDDEEAEDEEDDEEAKAAKAAKSSTTVSASTAASITAHGADLETRLVALESREASAERKRLIAAHGGVPKGMARLLATKPLGEVKSLLAELPKPKKPKLGDHAATATVAGTRGADEGKASQLPPEEAKAMRQAMGMESEKFGVVDRGNVTMLGASESDGGKS